MNSSPDDRAAMLKALADSFDREFDMDTCIKMDPVDKITHLRYMDGVRIWKSRRNRRLRDRELSNMSMNDKKPQPSRFLGSCATAFM